MKVDEGAGEAYLVTKFDRESKMIQEQMGHRNFEKVFCKVSFFEIHVYS